MAHRLSTLETGFLHAEDTDQHTNLGIGGLAILNGPIPDHDSLMETLGERIAACPRFAQRLNRQILDLGAPQWVDDDRFSMARHVTRVAVPAPGTDADLFAVVADVMSWRLDRARPLWEIWIIEGLSDNRWALLMKVHPCLADGIATMHILTGLSDDGISGGARHLDPTAAPGGIGSDTVTSPWPKGVGMLVTGITQATEALRATTDAALALLRPASLLTGPTSGRRRYVAAQVDLGDVRQICRAFDVTVNDVALAALTESYRTMLLQRGERPQPDSLRTLVPDTGQSALLPCLPVDEENPVLRLRLVRNRLAGAKTTAQRQAANPLAAVARALPFPVTAWGMKALTRMPQRSVAALAVNLPGPSQPLRLMGCDVVTVLPIPPIAMQLRTGAATLSYNDRLFFGILADYRAVPDADELARGIEAAVARLLARGKRRNVLRDRHGLSLVVNA